MLAHDPVADLLDGQRSDGKGLRKLTDEEAKHAPPANGEWSRDRKRAVYVSRGDVFLYDSTAKKRRALTHTIEAGGDVVAWQTTLSVLRRKLGDAASLETVRGVGFRLVLP